MQESLSKEVDYGETVVSLDNHVVRELPYSTKNLKLLWEVIKPFKNLANVEIRGDFKSFVSVFFGGDIENPVAKGLIWVVDDFKGLFTMNNITSSEATVHIAILNKAVKDASIAKEMLRYVFKTFKFQRLTAELPVYVKDEMFDFIKQIGFIEEGNKRKCIRYDNKWFDLRLYGILATEVLGVEALMS